MKEEKGNVIIEAAIVLPIILIGITCILQLFYITYQKIQVNTVAAQAAVAIGNNFATINRDPFYNIMFDSELKNLNLYRKFENGNDLTSNTKRTAKNKATWYSFYQLNKNRIIKAQDTKVEVSFRQKPEAVFQQQVIVTIEEEYKLSIVKLFTGKDKYRIKGEAIADCADFIDYFNTIDTIYECKDALEKLLKPGIVESIEKIIGWFKE